MENNNNIINEDEGELKDKIDKALSLIENSTGEIQPLVQVFSGDGHQVTNVQQPKKKTSVANRNERGSKGNIKMLRDQIEDLHLCRERLIKSHEEYKTLAENEIQQLKEENEQLKKEIAEIKASQK